MSDTERPSGPPTIDGDEDGRSISAGFAAAGHWTPISDADRARLAEDLADLRYYHAMKEEDGHVITAGYVPPPDAVAAAETLSAFVGCPSRVTREQAIVALERMRDFIASHAGSA